MEFIHSYFEPKVEALIVGFLIYLPFLANRYLDKVQELNKRRR